MTHLAFSKEHSGFWVECRLESKGRGRETRGVFGERWWWLGAAVEARRMSQTLVDMFESRASRTC